ncbi:MAG: hypothetical protein FJ290_30820, partial [Planctomycetes bacterium]|nr:hypothetical protein [Planctomycetota bacterium]
MDLLERAGLAALYMTLRAASEREVDLSPLGWQEMDLTSHSVTVRWEGPPKAAFARLFEWAWQVRDGVLFLPAVHRMQIDCENVFRRIPVHSGILRTFLQHPRVQPKGELVMRSDEIEEGKQLVTRYISLEGKTLKPVQDLP